MSICNRRVFAWQLVAGGSVLATASAHAADAPVVKSSPEKVTEADPYARSMGFRLDTTQVDKIKFPRHTEAQRCSECQLYSGKAGDPTGPCSFYGGRQVPPDGWCRNFKVRKAKA